jgi:NAD(P)-dependent dehydrogenase (short-subunit alcohol dehydrogenase family)
LRDAAWDKAIAVNLSGTLATIQAAAAAMISQKSGRIIVTSSISGVRASSVSGYAYVAAKAALNNIVRHACVDLGRHNITVNAIAPGYIVTNIANGVLKKDAGIRNKLVESAPLCRLGVPEDVAALALFLASDASSYITGTVIPVDGGAMAK